MPPAGHGRGGEEDRGHARRGHARRRQGREAPAHRSRRASPRSTRSAGPRGAHRIQVARRISRRSWAPRLRGPPTPPSDVLRDTGSGAIYALLAGRWFRAASLDGPWTFVASDALPADFARIPPTSLAGAVLPAVAGTPQAREAVAENAIPQTATVPRSGGPAFTATYDGAPRFEPEPGTSLARAVNASVPIVRTSTNAHYALKAGIWFTAAQPAGPWTVATSVPPDDLHDPAHVADLLRDLRAHLRRRPRHACSRATRRAISARWWAAAAPSCSARDIRIKSWIGERWFPAPVDLWRGGDARVQSARGLHVCIRGGAGHGRLVAAVFRRRAIPSRLLGQLSVLRIGERQRVSRVVQAAEGQAGRRPASGGTAAAPARARHRRRSPPRKPPRTSPRR